MIRSNLLQPEEPDSTHQGDDGCHPQCLFVLILEQTAIMLYGIDEQFPSHCEMHTPTKPRYDTVKSLYHKRPVMLYGIVEHSCLLQSEFK